MCVQFVSCVMFISSVMQKGLVHFFYQRRIVFAFLSNISHGKFPQHE
uniref:Uncharacterized protein n=1 Tax=Anguilla anguilla TaxID=7936 RepID=A0A0E9RMD8_ANGAN